MDTPDTPTPEPPPDDRRGHETRADSSPSASAGLAAWFRDLRRSTDGRLLGGVASGIAESLGLPPLLLRVAFVLAGVLGVGVPVYVLAWVLVPDDREGRVLGHGPVRDLAAIGAVAVAAILLLHQAGEVAVGSLLGRSIPWFLILVGLGLVLRRSDRSASPGPGRSGASAGPANPFTTDPVPPPPAGYRYAAAGPDPLAGPRSLPTPRPRRAPRSRPVVGPLTWCAALVAVGIVGVVATRNPSSVGPGAMAAVAMLVVGIGLVFSAVRGRARGLLLPAAALGLGLAGLAALDVRADNVEGPFSERVTSASALRPEYVASFGSARLDLLDLDLDTNREVTVRLTAGSLDLLLPRDVRTTVDYDIGTGSAWVGGASGTQAVRTDAALRTRWATSGIPELGTELAGDETYLLRSGFGYSFDPVGMSFTSDREPRGRFTSGPDDGPELRLRVELGAGDLDLVEARWVDVPSSVIEPVQLCAVAGGPVGVERSCGEIPELERVPLCIAEYWSPDAALVDGPHAVDCRDAPESVPNGLDPEVGDLPAACLDVDASLVVCRDVGIRPLGLPAPAAADPATSVPSSTAPDGVERELPGSGATVAPPPPPATVPPNPVPAPAPSTSTGA